MSGFGTSAPTVRPATRNSISVPFVVLASALAGVGLFLLLLWLITFDWLFFVGIVPILGGGLMFFSRRAGSDRAE